MAVMLVTFLKSTCNHAPRVAQIGAQAPLPFRRAFFAGEHGRALLAVKEESGMERSCSPSAEPHSTEHQEQRKVLRAYIRT